MINEPLENYELDHVISLLKDRISGVRDLHLDTITTENNKAIAQVNFTSSINHILTEFISIGKACLKEYGFSDFIISQLTDYNEVQQLIWGHPEIERHDYLNPITKLLLESYYMLEQGRDFSYPDFDYGDYLSRTEKLHSLMKSIISAWLERKNYNNIQTEVKVRKQRALHGKQSGAARLEKSKSTHEKILQLASDFISQGRAKHELTGLISQRPGIELSKKQIRRILQENGIIKKRT